MPVNEPELVGGVLLLPDGAAPVVAVRLKVPDEAKASESVTCTPNTVIDPSGSSPPRVLVANSASLTDGLATLVTCTLYVSSSDTYIFPFAGSNAMPVGSVV